MSGDDDWLDALGEVARARVDAELDHELPPDLASAIPPNEEQLARALAAAQRGVAAEPAPVAEVIPLRRWMPAITTLAMAALALFVWLPASPTGALPPFQLELIDAPDAQRGAEDHQLLLAANRSVILVARPEHAISGKVEAAVGLRTFSGLIAVKSSAEMSESGSLRVKLRPPSELPEAGEVVVWIARPGVLEGIDSGLPPKGVQELTWPFERLD